MQMLPPPVYTQALSHRSPMHEYRVQAQMNTRWIYFWLIPLELHGVVHSAWRQDRFGVATAVFAMSALILAAWLSGSTRLVVSPEGMTYYRLGSALFASWDEMQSLGRSSQPLSRSLHGIVLTHAEWQYPRWKVWVRRLSEGFIPLRSSSMGRYWQYGVGNELAYNVPWLYDTMPPAWRA